MSSIDELFKPHLNKTSSSANPQKRKFDPTSQAASEAYKAAKVHSNGDVKNQKYQRAHVEEDMEEDDSAAGPERPPEDDDDMEAGPSLEEEGDNEDEEGRFFGGGVSNSAKAAMSYLDAREEDGDDPTTTLKIDAAWARRQAQTLDRRIAKNSELRGKFSDEPAKFMASEADLDAEIKACSTLTDHPELYSDFVDAGGIEKLVGLLAHENTDIAIDAMQVLSELTDEDVSAEQEQWDALVAAMLDADIVDLLASNWERLDESEETDRNGVYHSISLLENIASRTNLIERVISNPKVFDWLLARIQLSERERVTQNKQYAAEILSIYAQSSNAAASALVAKDAVDTILQLLAYYRKTDPPKGSDEEEYAENLFDTLTCSVDAGAGKQAFVDAEGIELILIMLQGSKFSKLRALKVLDHAASTQNPDDRPQAIAVCERLVEAAGLKPLFAAFQKASDRASQAHFIGVFASMLRLLPGDSPERIRTLAKFEEKDHRTIVRMISLRREFAARLTPVEVQINAERAELSTPQMDDDERLELEDEFLSRRLDAGLYSVRTIDLVLAWLVAEDEGARTRVVNLLAERGEGLKEIAASLRDILDGLGEAPEPGDVEDQDGEVPEDMERDMLGTLLEFLQ